MEVSSDTNDPITITVNGSVLINGGLPADGPLDPNMVQELVIHGGNSENVIDLTGVLNTNFPNLSNAKITVDGGDADDSILASPIGGVYRGGERR